MSNDENQVIPDASEEAQGATPSDTGAQGEAPADSVDESPSADTETDSVEATPPDDTDDTPEPSNDEPVAEPEEEKPKDGILRFQGKKVVKAKSVEINGRTLVEVTTDDNAVYRTPIGAASKELVAFISE